jgi:hypothetical protein
MNIAELKGEKTVKALAKRLLAEQPKGRGKKNEADMEAALLRANPHLKQIDSLDKGTPVIVPNEFALDRDESTSPFTDLAEDLLKQSETVLADIREQIAAQVRQSAEETDRAQKWVQSDEAKQLLRASPVFLVGFAAVTSGTKVLVKEQNAALAAEDKGLGKIRTDLGAFRGLKRS